MRGMIDHDLLDRVPIGQFLFHQSLIARSLIERSLIDGRRIAINCLGVRRCVLRIDGD